MKKTFLKLGILLSVLLVFTGAADGCDGPTPSASVAEQAQVQDTHAKQVLAVPLPQLTNSLERINIKKRLETFDNPNKVSYIYLVSYGRVMSFYTIKGKVTSGNKRLTSTQEQHGSCDNYQGDNCTAFEAPELDGSYGSSAPYIFFWTTDNIYVQWSGDYMLVDQPLSLTSTPELVRNVTSK